MREIQLIKFVWNADFSVRSGLRALKEITEGHHSCTLCEIAYHRVRQTEEWKQYKKELSGRFDAGIREPCRNQLSAADVEAAGDDFPTVLVYSENDVIKLVGAGEIDECTGSFEMFRDTVEAALARFTA